MSLDALRLVSEYMSPAGRINLAQTSSKMCNDLTRWEDVHSLLFGDTKVLMAGEVFRHKIDIVVDLDLRHTMEKSFTLCPHVRRLWIQTRLQQEHIEELQKRSNTMEELHISSENFDTQYPITWKGFQPSRLRSLNILQRMDQPLNMRQVIDSNSCQALFPITLRRVSLTGIVLSRELMDTILTLTNLRHFDAIGCVIDTNMASEYVEKLGQLSNLDEMSMPPSMFSFSTKDENNVKFSMRKLRLSRLSLFMEQFDENTFFEQLEMLMPKKLEALILYGNYFPLKKSKKYVQWRKFEILFGAMIPQVKTQWWMREECLLMSHLVRNSPYRISEDFRPTRNAAGSWRFDQAAMDNDNARQERQNPSLNRILRFMRPEGALQPQIIGPRLVPEAPPPPRRERTRLRPNVPTVSEEGNAASNATVPPVSTVPAPVAFIVPIAPPQSVDSSSNAPTVLDSGATATQPPPIPSTQLMAPTVQSDFAHGRRQGDDSTSLTTPRVVEPGTNPPASTPMQDPGPLEATNRIPQTVQIEEVPADTVTALDQPQSIITSPGDVPLVATQPTSPDGAQTASTPQLFVIGSGTIANPIEQPQARNEAERFGSQPEHGPGNVEHDAHHVEENINMVLQGMLQALVEEIVFDAVNEERMENPATDPSPAVSSNVSTTNRTNNVASSAVNTTPTRATTPHVEPQSTSPHPPSAQQPSEGARNRQH